MFRARRFAALAIAGILLLAGCATVQPGWGPQYPQRGYYEPGYDSYYSYSRPYGYDPWGWRPGYAPGYWYYSRPPPPVRPLPPVQPPAHHPPPDHPPPDHPPPGHRPPDHTNGHGQDHPGRPRHHGEQPGEAADTDSR